MTLPFGETVVIVTPPGKDAFGDPLSGSPAEVTVLGCSVWPIDGTVGSDEIGGDRNTLVERLSVLLPDDLSVEATDKVRVRGLMYEVEGAPKHWMSEFTGSYAGTELTLSRVTG